MDFKQIAPRIADLGTPVFGKGPAPPKADVAGARRLMAFLEDRRVLYSEYELEVPRQCIESVLAIRSELVGIVGRLGPESKIAAHLRAILAACREFLDETNHSVRNVTHHSGVAFACFGEALGRLRAAVGLRLAIIAVMCGVNVGSELATILPPKVSADGT